jgi:hypothetical protein
MGEQLCFFRREMNVTRLVVVRHKDVGGSRCESSESSTRTWVAPCVRKENTISEHGGSTD